MTGWVEISKEEIPGSKRCMYGYTDLLQALKGERLSTVFSPDGTLICAFAAPHLGVVKQRQRNTNRAISACVKKSVTFGLHHQSSQQTLE